MHFVVPPMLAQEAVRFTGMSREAADRFLAGEQVALRHGRWQVLQRVKAQMDAQQEEVATYMELQPSGEVLAIQVQRGVVGLQVVGFPGESAVDLQQTKPPTPSQRMQQLRRQVLGSKKGRW